MPGVDLGLLEGHQQSDPPTGQSPNELEVENCHRPCGDVSGISKLYL